MSFIANIFSFLYFKGALGDSVVLAAEGNVRLLCLYLLEISFKKANPFLKNAFKVYMYLKQWTLLNSAFHNLLIAAKIPT
jgi:hypothetical protein